MGEPTNIFSDSRCGKWGTYFWTVILFAIIVNDFASNNANPGLIAPACAIYTAVLGIYSADKEFMRWNHQKRGGPHPGEIFVIFWTALIVSIMITDFVQSRTYVMPDEITTTYIIVLGILVLTARSKALFRERHRTS